MVDKEAQWKSQKISFVQKDVNMTTLPKMLGQYFGKNLFGIL